MAQQKHWQNIHSLYGKQTFELLRYIVITAQLPYSRAEQYVVFPQLLIGKDKKI
jgi:hypothetical protein